MLRNVISDWECFRKFLQPRIRDIKSFDFSQNWWGSTQLAQETRSKQSHRQRVAK